MGGELKQKLADSDYVHIPPDGKRDEFLDGTVLTFLVLTWLL
ncbi:hypothetical protein [Nitrospira sp. Kam-Ns4a]